MAEAGSLQATWEANRERGFMVITALDGNETEDLAAWADEYGLDHPVVGDGDGTFFWDFSKNSAWPMVVIIDHGMVIVSADEGWSESQIDELLAQYE
jgi:hypothetical protein